jgi:hypothetical protein
MRRIDKRCHLAAAYKKWHDELEEQEQDHPTYSSSNQYYWDVVMNLYACQGGLCAYTEVALCPPELFDAGKWAVGKYSLSPAGKPQVKGQLEHFDSQLKTKKGWLWDNLFMVDSDINMKIKRTRAIDPILKPDADDYNEFEKLEYNPSMHVFIPHSSLSNLQKARIDKMLLILGINHDTVRYQRKCFLTRVLKEIDFGVADWAVKVEQFPTAFEMVRRDRSDAVEKTTQKKRGCLLL